MSETLQVPGIGSVEVSFHEVGQGEPILLLHGGAGPLSVAGWAELLARKGPARVICPTHPGFMGTPRPEALNSVAGLARVYGSLLEKLDLNGVTVIGNSVGGWIAAELALQAPRRLRGLVIIDAAGLEVPGHPIADVFSMPLDEISRLSYHDPTRFRLDPSKFTPQQRAAMAGNMATLKIYSGKMADPTLRGRLPGISVPTLVAWGASDRVIDPEHGRAYAAAIPGARFHLQPGAGHLPQLEAPEPLTDEVLRFWKEHPSHPPRSPSA
jgi:pimeloyl-ACP methyl ester carboxylesterase